MLLTKEVEVSWHHLTRKHYENLGYTFTKYYTKFKTKVEHLTNGSHVEIEFKCDYCRKKDKKAYKTYLIQRKTSQSDCCVECCNLKSIESMNKIHGVSHAQMLDSVKQKTKHTCKEKYGVDNPMKVKEIAEKCTTNKNQTIYKKQ